MAILATVVLSFVIYLMAQHPDHETLGTLAGLTAFCVLAGAVLDLIESEHMGWFLLQMAGAGAIFGATLLWI